MSSISWIRYAGIALIGVLLGCTRGTAAPEPSVVQLETEDGFLLYADFVPSEATDPPVALLLHMYHSDRRAWGPLVPRLTKAGFAVLALDQRAHGESTKQGEATVRVADVPRSRFASLVRKGPLDVKAARSFLLERGLSAKRLVLVGASYGCTVALLSANRVPGIKAVALLSPGTAYFGVDVKAAARDFSGELLAVAAEDDPRSAESARALTELHRGEQQLLIFPSGGHGTRLFGPRPEVLDQVVEFLVGAIG
jgi:pimeloyl-ACP methyl ester carboxylesterase